MEFLLLQHVTVASALSQCTLEMILLSEPNLDTERLQLDPSLAFTSPSSSFSLSSDVLTVLVALHWTHSSLHISLLH